MTLPMSGQNDLPDSFSAYRSPMHGSSFDEKSTPSSKETQGSAQDQFYDSRDVTPSPETSSASTLLSEIHLTKRPVATDTWEATVK